MMQSAVDVGVFVAVGVGDGVDDLARLLRGRAIVEICQRFAMDRLRQNGKVRADGLDIEARIPHAEILGAEILGRWCEDGHRLIAYAAGAPSHSAAAALKASCKASFSRTAKASPTNAWISSARASCSGRPRDSR